MFGPGDSRICSSAAHSVDRAVENMLGGYLSDRLQQPTVIMAISLIFLAITTAALIPVGWGVRLIALILINAMFVQFYFGPIFALPVERYGARMMGTLSGFANFLANLGSFSFTYLLGALKDRTGYFGSGFYALTGASVVGLALTFWLERMRRRPAANPE
jgi:nitrate/nitrite transporter NarK